MTQNFFRLAEAPRQLEDMAVLVRAKITGEDGRKILVTVPSDVEARLSRNVTGPVSNAIIALAEYAMDRLDKENKMLVVDNVTKA